MFKITLVILTPFPFLSVFFLPLFLGGGRSLLIKSFVVLFFLSPKSFASHICVYNQVESFVVNIGITMPLLKQDFPHNSLFIFSKDYTAHCLFSFHMCDTSILIFGIKGALDKYNIYLFISNSIEYFKLNQYQNFQMILPMRFHFMRYFVISIISSVSHRLLYSVFIEVDFEK